MAIKAVPTFLLMQEYAAQSKTHGGQGSNQYTKEQMGQNDPFAKQVHGPRDIVAQNHGISSMAVRRAVEFGRGLDKAEEVSPTAKAGNDNS